MNQSPPSKRPAVVIWYKIYCALMAIGYFLFTLYVAFLIWFPKDQIASQGQIAKKIIFALEYTWGGLLVGTIIVTFFFIAALFLPRRSWVWIYGIVAISIGLLNCCCFPLSIPVFIFWFRPETKQYFGYGI